MVSGKPLLVVAMAAMLVLAGCSFGQSTQTESTTTAPTTDPGDGTGADDIETQDWMTADGVDAKGLVDAHYGSLSGTSYQIETYQNSSGLLSLERTSVQRIGADGNAVIEFDTVSSNGNFSTRAYVDDSWVVMESTNETQTISSAYQPPDTDAEFNQSQSMVQYIKLGNYSVNRTFEVDGETRIEYVATESADIQAAESVTSFDGRFVVSTDGRLHSLTVNATQESQYGQAQSHFEYSLSEVGSIEVSEPAWVADVKEAATTVDFSYSYDGSVIEIEHNGGDTVGAGTQIVVQPTEGRGVGYAELPSDFEPGQTIYITPGQGQELEVSYNATSNPESSFGTSITLAMYGGKGETVVKTELIPETNESARVGVMPVRLAELEPALLTGS